MFMKITLEIYLIYYL